MTKQSPGNDQHGAKKSRGKKTGLKHYEEANFIDTSKPVWNYSLFTQEDIANYQAGTHYSIY